MHNALSRLQNVFGFFTTVASFVALAIAIVSLVSTPVPDLKDGSLKLRNVQVAKGRPHYYSQKKEEYAHIKFDLDVDLSTLFTWNTKQVFLYITASYPGSTSSSPSSSSIIWDAILPHPLAPAHHNTYIPPTPKGSKRASSSKPKTHPGILKLDSQRPKYQITDSSGKMANKGNATLELHYNIQPWVGALTWGRPAASVSEQSGSGRVLSGFAETDFLARFVAGWTQRAVGSDGRSKSFALPGLKEKGEAKGKEAEELKVAKGKEERRGPPS